MSITFVQKKKQIIFFIFLSTIILLTGFFITKVTAVTFTQLYEFDGTDGNGPMGQMILSGSTLYGMTEFGGVNDKGIIYSIATNGTGFTTLRDFAGGVADGSRPQGTLTLSGSTLYGVTYGGGTSNKGTIFSIATNGTGYNLLHSFDGTNGSYPQGVTLALSGSTLYGMTYDGGSSNLGTIFSIATNGTGFTVLHPFTGVGSDGSRPEGSVIVDGSTLYGMTLLGGTNGRGVIFSIATNGTGYTTLRSFNGNVDPTDGDNPRNDFIISGSTLYGMTEAGGANAKGTIFSIATNGTGFALLHSFGGVGDGNGGACGSLTLVGSTLYGMSYQGGADSSGAVFSIDTDGSGYTSIYEFDGTDGAFPYYGAPVVDGSTIYGMTYLGGSGWYGNVFSLATTVTRTLTYTVGAHGSITAPATTPTTHGDGDVVTITAVPDSHYHFVNWTGDVGTVADVNVASTTITMNGDYSITANFAIDTHTLTYTVGANGSITAPATTPTTYNYGSSVTITAVADSHYHFVNWTGDVTTVADVNAASTTITMNGDYSITANFAIDTHTLTYTAGANGSITAPATTPTTHNYGSSVTITAVANTGYHFVNWTGDVSTVADIDAASTTIIMNGDYNIIANFAPNGGGGPVYPPPVPPVGNFGILINDGAEFTTDRAVSLKLFGGPDTVRMAISNFSDLRDAGQENYQTTKPWILIEGEGTKVVYAKFYNQSGQASEIVSDSIILLVEEPPLPVKPILTSINPDHKNVNASAFIMTLLGSNFIPSSVARFEGSYRTTLFVNPNVLKTEILSSDLKLIGNFKITVFNPGMGGGESNSKTFSVVSQEEEPEVILPVVPPEEPEVILPVVPPEEPFSPESNSEPSNPSNPLPPETNNEPISQPVVPPAGNVDPIRDISFVLFLATLASLFATASVYVASRLPLRKSPTLLYMAFLQPFILFFDRRKRRGWGIVYDSITKKPLDLVPVRLLNAETKTLISTKITDKEGRYFFAVDPGLFLIVVNKDEYVFPSKLEMGVKEDPPYINLYHGEVIEIKKKDTVINVNIPIDPEKKVSSNKWLVKNYLSFSLKKAVPITVVIMSLFSYLVYPNNYLLGFFILNVLIFILMKMIKPKVKRDWGIVADRSNKKPLSLAVVRIYEANFNKLIDQQVTNGRGQYGFLVGGRKFYLTYNKEGYLEKTSQIIDFTNQKKGKIVGFDAYLEQVKK